MKLIVLGTAFLALCVGAAIAQPVAANPTTADSSCPVSTRNIKPSAQQIASMQQANAIYMAGVAALQAQDFVDAEDDFQQVISISPIGFADRDLAEALVGQGRIAEAIQTYQAAIDPDGVHVTANTSDPRALWGYAILLSQTGQWTEAVTVYNAALPFVSAGGPAPDLTQMPPIALSFDPADPQPTALQAVAYIGLGLDAGQRCDTDGYLDNNRAFVEYKKALQLEPNWAVANYYYGYGWSQLSPSQRVNQANAQQAKAALHKAVKFGKADIKKAAEKALKAIG